MGLVQGWVLPVRELRWLVTSPTIGSGLGKNNNKSEQTSFTVGQALFLVLTRSNSVTLTTVFYPHFNMRVWGSESSRELSEAKAHLRTSWASNKAVQLQTVLSTARWRRGR